MDKKVLKRIVRSRSDLIVLEPFYGCLALNLELVECTNPAFVSTMAVDGVHWYYFPDFVDTLSELEIIGVGAHEVSHCSYNHMTRRGRRNPLLYNIAGDYAINQDLLAAKFTLPKERLFDPKYNGMNTEEIYDKLLHEAEKKGKKPGEGLGSGKDAGGCGAVLDAPSPEEAEAIQREWQLSVRQAVAIARARNAGRLPAHLQRFASALNAPKVDWRDATRNFVDQSMSRDWSYARPNRRSHGGMILPSTISDSMNRLVLCLDTSGSVSKEMQNQMLSEAAATLNDGISDTLTVVYADAAVGHVDEYVRGDLITNKQFPGGGGTDFRHTFQWIAEHAADASCVIYLTDMITSSFGEEPHCQVLWGAFLPGAMLAHIKPPFGQVVKVSTEN